MEGRIINITRFCTNDGPGIRTTVFLKGCPLRCIWCHNPESQNPNEEHYINGEKIGQTMTAEEVVAEAVKDKVFYEASGGGVTISGGEPLSQPKFTAEILKLCKESTIHTAVETSGFANPEILISVLKNCNFVLFDIKETSEKNHLKFTGVNLEPIIKNLRLINELQIPFIIRAPIIPGLNDRCEHLLKVKKLADEMIYCQGAEIMPYHKLGEYKYKQLSREYLCKNIVEPTKAQIQEWKNIIKNGV